MKNILVVVDMQNDFVDGALGSKEAVSIVDNVVEEIKAFDGEVVFTKDTHGYDYLTTQEGQILRVPHCVKDTKGWQLNEKIAGVMTDEMKVFEKPAFGSVELAKYLTTVTGLENVTLVGLCTDICVISNALLIKAFLPEVKVSVIEKCCAGVTPKTHENALDAMKMCQVEIIL
jgi:nicotinamidase-related amidase